MLLRRWRLADGRARLVWRRGETEYLNAARQPLSDVAILILETGVRPGEAANLQWSDVYRQPAVHAELGYIAIRNGKSKNARRNLSLTARAAEMLRARKAAVKSPWVFPGDSAGAPILGTSLDHHYDVRDNLKLSKDFVAHSLRHTMLTRLGESGAGGEVGRREIRAGGSGASGGERGAKVVKGENGRPRESAQVFEFKRTGP